MPNYKRNYQKGGTYFFTVVTGNRAHILRDGMIDVLRACFRDCMQRSPFRMDAVVILPDHIHCLWSLPEGDDNYSIRWRLIKTSFTKSYIRSTDCSTALITERMQKKGEAGIWQRRFWEHTIRDDHDFRRHLDYIHYNPVKHGYASSPAQWPHSSFKQYVARGFYAADWGAFPVDLPEMDAGE